MIRLSSSKLFKIVWIIDFLAEGSTPEIGSSSKNISAFLERLSAICIFSLIPLLISFTFALGSALAGAAGVMIGMYYNSIDPLMGMIPGLKAFIAAVFGGIGIIPGAMLGGEAIGILETLASGYGFSMIKDAVVYLILIVILIIKPSGLLGKNVKEKV